ncbi:hypothetical protein LTR05_006767 [Lithohypha guttulata]|uniref:T6SS Phospholipase effector Tle1-like catalytic domain-containing protein n=1 Tax=Lithohypha guttulata TaxID=1690604 RepID=A0AAN7SWY3_9EURO|nr:hypothetical protein LTR05_006767 [Lithohypha guttulata]
MDGAGRASHVSGFAPVPAASLGPSVASFVPPPGASTTFAVPPPAHHFAASGHFNQPSHVAAQSALSIPPGRMEPPPLSSTAGPMPGTVHNPIMGPRKRLIVTCDGTWLDADNGLVNGQKQPPSNVSRFGWAVKDTSRDGIPQVVNYQAGVASSGGRISRAVGGATGLGLKENIREAYTYLATNWREGDEIFLLGFSRGAFTARSIGGLIGSLGLLTRRGLPSFGEIFEDWEHRLDNRYQSSLPDSPFHNKGPFDERYVHELERLGMTKRRVPIKAICCWDTVGSLGIPRTPWLEMFIGQGKGMKDYQFVDTRIHPCVENAFHALALDEQRAPFSPAVWEKQADNNVTNLKQVWFPGVHSNVGGGYDDQELANITLAWMMSRLEPFLDFRPDFLVTQLDAQKQYYRDTDQKPRKWAFGEIYRSLKGAYSLTGRRVRTPGAYQRVDPMNGQPTGKKLKNTNEYIHASVRARLGLRGPGPQDRGEYNPPALADWTFEPEPAPVGGTAQGQGGNLSDGMMVVWNYRGAKDRDGQTRIPEAVLLETELALLRQFQAVDDYIRYMRPPSGKRRSKRYRGMNEESHNNGSIIDEKRRNMGPAPDDFAEPMDGDIDGTGDHDRRRERKHRRRTRGTSLGPDAPPDDYGPDRRERDPDREERRKRRTSARY